MTKLDVELPYNSQIEFERKYLSLTEIVPKPDNVNYYVLHGDANKWGIELRIYFVSNENLPSSLKKRRVNARPGGPYNSRINDNEFVWELIKYGLRLSNVQNAGFIESKVPKTYKGDFQKGFLA